MKKMLAMLASLALAMTMVSVAFAADEQTRATEEGDAHIAAIYARPDVSADTQANDDGSSANPGVYTVLICYSDGSYREFNEANGDLELCSAGAYELPENGAFADESGALANLTLLHGQTYLDGKPVGFNYEHSFSPSWLGYELLYAYDEADPVTVEAVFVGIHKQRYVDESEAESMLDTCWIYYSDMTFDQYACVGTDVELFSTGAYEFAEDSSFYYDNDANEFGNITLNRNQKYSAGSGLQPYESSHTYDLNTLGFVEVALGSL